MLPIERFGAVAQVVEKMREGSTLFKACKDVGISRSAVVAFLRDNPEAARDFDQAAEEADDTLAEMLIDIDLIHADAKMATVVSKNIQWLLSRKRPGKYGDRMVVETKTTADNEIVMALRAAIDRIPVPLPQVTQVDLPIIDITPTVLAEPSLDDMLG